MAALCLCFLLSGLAGLVYQTAWSREFSLVFGTSAQSVAVVLAAFMGGLALGAAWIEPQLARVRRPLQLYARLELGTAIAALLVPGALALLRMALVASFGVQPEPPASTGAMLALLQLAGASAVLVVPSALMGATLPVLARGTITGNPQVGRRIGALYACNTAGAVLGALLTAFVLLPTFGLRRTEWTGAALNVIVALAALFLDRRVRGAEDTMTASPPPTIAPAAADIARATRVLPLMLCAGAVSFLLEVTWTRLLSHLLGSSISAFSLMLASFLAGIALGGALGGLAARDARRAAWWMAIGELAVALFTAAAWWGLQRFPLAPLAEGARIAGAALLLLPMTVAIGVSYPLAVRVLAHDASDAGASSARVYAWNTVGAIAGALLAGYVLLPWLRYEGAVRLAVGASALLAVLITAVLCRASWRVVAILSLACLAGVAAFQPQAPWPLLRHSPLGVSGEGMPLHYGVGRGATTVVLEHDGQLRFRTDGLPEATVQVRDRAPEPYAESWMVPLATLARPAARNLLVVGLGGGRVLESLPASLQHADVIEIEPEVVAANRAVAARRRVDPLADPRVRLISNDARNALLLTSARYDVIASQPSHPWTAGASHLYTREFLHLAHTHLVDDGVLVQWMNTDFVDEALLRALFGTLADEFRQVRVYRPGPSTLLLLASDATIDPERAAGATRTALAASDRTYSQVGLDTLEDLLAALLLDNAGVRALADGAPRLSDDRNRFATASLFDTSRWLPTPRLDALVAQHDPWRSYETTDSMAGGDFDWPTVAARALALAGADVVGTRTRVLALATRHADTPLQVRLQALAVSSVGKLPQAREILDIGAGLFPDDVALRQAALAASLPALLDGTAGASLRTFASAADGESRLLLECARLAAARRWNELAALDSGLARVAWTSPWSATARRLRAQWRLETSPGALPDNERATAVALLDADSARESGIGARQTLEALRRRLLPPRAASAPQ